MTLDALVAEIANQAEAKAEAIVEAAQAEAKKIEERARNEVSEVSSVSLVKAEKERAQLSVEVVASAKQANQKKVLIAQREELDATWETVKKEVSSTKMKGRKKILDSLVGEVLESDFE